MSDMREAVYKLKKNEFLNEHLQHIFQYFVAFFLYFTNVYRKKKYGQIG